MKIGAYIKNPALLRRLLRKIVENRLPIKLLSKLSDEVDVIITDSPGEIVGKDKVALIVKDSETVDKVVEEVKLLLKRKIAYNILAIGIDPGKRTGIAVLGDGEFLEGKTFDNEESLINYVLDILEKYLHNKCVIRIGFKEPSSSIIAELIYRNIKSTYGRVDLEFVSENKTTKPPITPMKPEHKVPRDVASAIHIALKRGLRVEWENA